MSGPPDAQGWPLPPRPRTATGEARRVGVELELQGVPVADLAALVAQVLDGETKALSAVRYLATAPGGEPWRVEVDYLLLQQLADQAEAGDPLKSLLADALESATSLVVPCEIVSPPLPVERMGGVLERLVHALRDAGARGTRHTPWYAFGVHFNVDPPDLEADTLRAYLQAFICAYDWLLWHGRVDPARRLTPYIDGFPRDYELLVTRPEYAPAFDRLADDYLAHNPTRNRGLDLLPLLMHRDEQRVRAVVDDPLVVPRPALHYRLANCSVDEPAWSLRDPWADWVAVERLADDGPALAACCAAFREHRQQLLHPLKSEWRKASVKWLEP